MIAEDVIQRIKEENDIVDVISESVKLRSAGRNYIGLCPFHHEKTPSFSVSPDKQIYKCFGCGEAGNVFTFVMKNRNLTFLEAVNMLAARANIIIEEKDSAQKNHKEGIQKLYQLHVEAARYFFQNLRNHKEAQSYLAQRGISEQTIKRFGLGYALDRWDGVIRHLKKRGFSDLDLLSAGLTIKSKKGSYYDRFRNRIIFPVFDHQGKVIGFGGRVLDDSKPKYLNSPETQLFKKGTNLYGLNFAIKYPHNKVFLMVEGYMDCISLHQHGITNVVASLGTALTTSQAKLLKRYADKIIIAYDADVAGQAATLRGLEILRQEGFDMRVLAIPKGKDPDEFIKKQGKAAFEKLMQEALPLIEYRIKRAAEGIDFTNGDMIIIYLKRITEILADLDPVEKDVYIKKASEETGIKEQAIYDVLIKEMHKNSNKLHKMNIEEDFGQKLYVEPAYMKSERTILKYMLFNDEICQYVIAHITEQELISDSHQKIYTLLVQHKDAEESEKIRRLELACNDPGSAKEWIAIMELQITQGEYDHKKIIQDCIKNIRKFKLEESKKEIMIKIKQYEAQGRIDETMNLTMQLMEIQKEIGNL